MTPDPRAVGDGAALEPDPAADRAAEVWTASVDEVGGGVVAISDVGLWLGWDLP